MELKKENLIKSPIVYAGGKYKLLPQILPLFPDKISMFYDVFGGGGNVSLNCGADYIYYNDIINYIGDIFNGIKGVSPQESLQKILNIVEKYQLSKINEEGFKKLREDYNNGKNSWEYLYALIVHSFNYQMRFNTAHEYNSSFGRNRSYFSPVLQQKVIKTAERLNEIDIVFESKDFREVDYSDADRNDLVYFDPPYLLSCGVYQDGKRGFSGWGKQDELDLYNLCDKLDEQGTRFAISNVIESKGNVNEILKEWSKKYRVHYLNVTYNGCNYQRKINDKDLEVLITNY